MTLETSLERDGVAAPSSGRLRIGIVAGEASGDLLAAHLIRAVKAAIPGTEFYGIAGPKMVAAGAQALFPMEKLAVRGYVEVLRHYREIVGIRRALIRHFEHDRPDLYIGVDAPDFNLAVEEHLKRTGLPTIHYVGPSIWAWRAERIKKIKAAVSRMLVLFPFEQRIYEQAGIPVSYVGHPLAEGFPDFPDRAAARAQLKLPVGGTIVTLMPGSRQSEVSYMAETFIETAQLVASQRPDITFLVPLVSRETRVLFESVMHKLEANGLQLKVLFGHSHDAMKAADAVLVASGTATLEAALLKRPMVITYQMSPITWKMMMRRGYLPYVGLPNILSGRFVVPELLQRDATAENLSQALLNLLGDEVVKERVMARFADMHRELKQNTGERLVSAIRQTVRV